MKITSEINNALTVMQRYTELELSLRNLKDALKEVNRRLLDTDLESEIYKFEDIIDSKIEQYSYRNAVEYIKNNL